jgi:hypothetical protein
MKAECKERFRWQHDLFVASECATRGARTATCQRTYSGAFTTACKTPNDCSKSCSSSNESSRAFAFTTLCALNAAGGNRVATPDTVYTIQAQFESCATGEAAKRFGIYDRPVCTGSFGNYYCTFMPYIVSNRRGKRVSGLADFRAKVFIEAYTQVRSNR